MSHSAKVFYPIGLLALMVSLAGCGTLPAAAQSAGEGNMMIEAWHADSLAGPMSEMKKAFETRNPNIRINLTSGRSKELAAGEDTQDAGERP